jgi:hypothetical protein
MTERNLTAANIAAYVQEISAIREAKRRERPVARTFNGFGTKLYGKRDFLHDGSYLTTLWIVLFWFPLIPLRSFRVQDAGPGERTCLPGWSKMYVIVQESRPNLWQALSVYGFSLGFGGILAAPTVTEPYKWIALLLWSFVPWAVRTLAKKAATPSNHDNAN